jgi:hypothetical protein
MKVQWKEVLRKIDKKRSQIVKLYTSSCHNTILIHSHCIDNCFLLGPERNRD